VKSAFRNLNGAVSLLTTLPTPNSFPDKPGRAYAYFPLVGVLVGTVLWAVGWLSGQVFPAQVRSIAVLLTWIVMTGGLHLDGFGDACDGLFAVVSVERRLEIMKDSRAGAWAVIGLCILLLGKWIAIGQTSPTDWLLAAVMGRFVMVLTAVSYPYARSGGMGGMFREGLGRREVIIAAVTTVIVLAFYVDQWLPIVIVLVLVAGASRWMASRLGGGLTGDTYGALCELTEILLLLALSGA
jgi:adenosylcobinamide-GDP ribazoletransferase